MIVAPNSPRARAKASNVPAIIPRAARGMVMVKNTRQFPAPSVRAICSNRGLTFSKATRAERTSNGSDITLNASNTARQVNMMSKSSRSWRKPPMTPRRPKISSRIKPVATGGITSGNETKVSTTDLPGQSCRASIQAKARPNGVITSVLKTETHAVNQTICHSSKVMPCDFSHAD